MYFAILAIRSPSSFSLTSLSILRAQSRALHSNIYTLISLLSATLNTLQTIKTLYTVEKPRLVDGVTEYTPPKDHKGMSFEFQ